MSYSKGLHKVLLIILLLGIFIFYIQPPALGATLREGDIQMNNRLDTIPEQANNTAPARAGDSGAINVPAESQTGLLTELGHSLVGGGKWIISAIGDLAQTAGAKIGDFWQALPDWAHGLLKGIVVGLIAAAVILFLATFGAIGLAAAVVGSVAAILAGMTYGLWVGGDDFQWSTGLVIAMAAGGVAVCIFELFGASILKGINLLLTGLNKLAWLKSAVRPFTVGGIINLGSYIYGHSDTGFTFWGILGSFIIGGLCGVLYGEMLLPWLQEARYLIMLRRYRWLLPLTKLLQSSLGKFFIYNVVGGGLLGALTTVVQNSFIGEPTTWPGLMGGMVAGFMAATVISSPFKGLARTIIKKYIKDILDNGLLEYFKVKLQNLLERLKSKQSRKGIKDAS